MKHSSQENRTNEYDIRNQHKKLHGVQWVKMDFDDLLIFTYKLFNNNEKVLSFYQRNFKYVLVDEYQDQTNAKALHYTNGFPENLCIT